MRSILAALGIATLVAATAGFSARSQEPSPTPGTQQEQPKTAEPSQRSQNQPSTSPAPPTIIYVQPPPKTDSEAENERRAQREKAEIDRRLVDLTGDLSGYTGGLYRATIALAIATFLLVLATAAMAVLGWRQIDIGRKSAGAAEKNADILLATQKPQVDFVKTVVQVVGVGKLLGFMAQTEWKNFGATPAIQLECNIRMAEVSSDKIDELTFVLERRDPTYARLGAQNTTHGGYARIKAAEAVRAWQKQSRIFIYSRAAYGSLFEFTPRETVEICNEMVFIADPRTFVGKQIEPGPFTVQFVRYGGPCLVIDENDQLTNE